MFGSVAGAEEWMAGATLGSHAEFNDNPRMLSTGQESTYGLVSILEMDLSRRTERSTLEIVPRVVVRRYTGDDDLDSDDLGLDAGYRSRTERGEYAFGAGYRRDGTLTSEFIVTGPVSANVPREIMATHAEASRNLNERTLLHGAVSYQDVSYEDGLRYGLFDYEYLSGLGYIQRSLSERTSVNLITRIALLEVPTTGVESRELTVGLGVDRAWSDRWKSTFSAGPTFSDVNGISNDMGTSFRADLSGTWERSSIRLEGERLLSPDAGLGSLETHDRFAVNARHQFTELLSATAFTVVDYYSDADDPRNRGGGYRSYGRAGGGLAWQATPEWNLSLGYEYSQRNESSDASGHRVRAGFTWHAPLGSVSR